MLANFSVMVDVSKAQAAVEADRSRELGVIGSGNLALLDNTVASALRAGVSAAIHSASELDAFACGEPEALVALRQERRRDALTAAVASGLVPAMLLLLERVDDRFQDDRFFAGYASIAAQSGHIGVLELLRDKGANLDEPSHVS